MARVYFELSDFAPLVQEIANRRRPLLERTFSHGPRLMQVNLDVTLHALKSIEADGPITVESEFRPGETWLNFTAKVPKLKLKIPCTLKRGTLLIKDGDWPLKVTFHCSISGRIHLIGGPGEKPLATASQRHIQVVFHDFQLRCPAFPNWLESPMRRILEGVMEAMIGDLIPMEVRRPFMDSLGAPTVPQTVAVVDEAPEPEGNPEASKSGTAYWSAYYLGYCVAFPALWISGASLRKTAAATGLREGAKSAANAAHELKERWTTAKK